MNKIHIVGILSLIGIIVLIPIIFITMTNVSSNVSILEKQSTIYFEGPKYAFIGSIVTIGIKDLIINNNYSIQTRDRFSNFTFEKLWNHKYFVYYIPITAHIIKIQLFNTSLLDELVIEGIDKS